MYIFIIISLYIHIYIHMHVCIYTHPSPRACRRRTDLLKVKYDGIRPAPGYPSQPDHTEKPVMWDLLSAKDLASIELNEHMAMLPAASVSHIFVLHRVLQSVV